MLNHSVRFFGHNSFLPRLGIYFFLLALSSTLSGCAAVFGKKIQEVHFDSEPRGAKVYVGGYFAGRTPVTVKLRITTEYDVVYMYGESVREFTITPINYTQHTANRVLCIIDLFPGTIFFGMPPLVDIFSGACRGFQKAYFKSMVGTAIIDDIDN